MNLSVREAAEYGFIFPEAKRWIGDAAPLTTAPNTTVPAEFTGYIDPVVVEILTAPRRARELFSEIKKGDWTTSHERFRVDEPAGRTAPYSDFGQAGTASVNYNWATREQYVFQTLIEYGDYEVAMSSMAKINLASDKQSAAANIIDQDANKFYLLGVANRAIYGLLNDPNLPSAITAASTGSSSSPLWSNKTTGLIYKDITDLFAELVKNSKGLIDQNSPLTLVVSPESSVELGKATDYNVSVTDMLNKFFRNLEIKTLPELSTSSGKKILLFAREVMGKPTAEFGFSEKIRAGRVIPRESSFSQKFTSTTYGCILYLPYAIAQMTGM